MGVASVWTNLFFLENHRYRWPLVCSFFPKNFVQSYPGGCVPHQLLAVFFLSPTGRSCLRGCAV